MSNTKIKPPMWFWIVSIVALLWNLMGVMAYLMDAYMKEEVMASFTAAQRSVFENQPGWVTGAYALAVFGGALACIGLLLRKKWATSLFIISLVAVLARTAYYFFMTDSATVFDLINGTILPVAVVVVAVLLLLFSRKSTSKNWLE